MLAQIFTTHYLHIKNYAARYYSTPYIADFIEMRKIMSEEALYITDYITESAKPISVSAKLYSKMKGKHRYFSRNRNIDITLCIRVINTCILLQTILQILQINMTGVSMAKLVDTILLLLLYILIIKN